jgi:hypothetical protein
MPRGTPPPGNRDSNAAPKPPQKAPKKSGYGVVFEEKISESVLSVTLGERLAKRAPMANIRGDRPPVL